MNAQFRDRSAAGRQLAKALSVYINSSDALLLALPRGGVPVAYEVAQALQLPLDVCIVRKLTLAEHSELAIGAIGLGGVQVLNDNVIKSLQISKRSIERAAKQEQQELNRRERAYRGHRPLPDIEGRTIVLVDDGIATGATMKAAIAVIQSQQPKEIIVAVPVAPSTTCQEIRQYVSRVVCLLTPSPFRAISLWYEYFLQTTDGQVNRLLSLSAAQR